MSILALLKRFQPRSFQPVISYHFSFASSRKVNENDNNHSALEFQSKHLKITQSSNSSSTPLLSQREFSAQQIQHFYMMLQSRSHDDYSKIVSSFINLKKKYIKRQIYLPNKKAYLEQLDRSFLSLRGIHTTHKIVKIQKEIDLNQIDRKDSLNDKMKLQVQQQLHQVQRKIRFEFVSDQKNILVAMYAFIGALGILEYYLF